MIGVPGFHFQARVSRLYASLKDFFFFKALCARDQLSAFVKMTDQFPASDFPGSALC